MDYNHQAALPSSHSHLQFLSNYPPHFSVNLLPCPPIHLASRDIPSYLRLSDSLRPRQASFRVASTRRHRSCNKTHCLHNRISRSRLIVLRSKSQNLDTVPRWEPIPLLRANFRRPLYRPRQSYGTSRKKQPPLFPPPSSARRQPYRKYLLQNLIQRPKPLTPRHRNLLLQLCGLT